MTESEETPAVPGDVLLGKYRVERVLGQGGMGVVVAARHIDLGELFAIKFLSTKALGVPDAVKRFLREARASARLKSEHVAKVHDVGNLESGMPYMVMEYLTGHDLKEHIRKSGQLPLQEAITLMLQACDAIAEAHARGIIHRDLKPSNLFVTRRRDGTPSLKVLDFGIAKEISADGADLTKSGAMLGSPLYMSPEQMMQSKSVDARTDIWSIGVVLYEMVTGTVPFDGETLTEIVSKVLQNTPTPPRQLCSELPSWVDELIAKCLEKHPENRFLTIEDFAAALRAGGDPKQAVLHTAGDAAAAALHDDLAVATTKKSSALSRDLATASTAEVEAAPTVGPAPAVTPNEKHKPRKPRAAALLSAFRAAETVTLESGPPPGQRSSDKPANTTIAESTWGNTRAERRTPRAAGKARIVAGGILGLAVLSAVGIWLLRGTSPGQDSSSSGVETPAIVTESATPAPSAGPTAPTEPVAPSTPAPLSTAASSATDPIPAASSPVEPASVASAGTRSKKSQAAPGGAAPATKRGAGTSPQATTAAAQNSLGPQPATTAAPSSSSKPKQGYEGVF